MLDVDTLIAREHQRAARKNRCKFARQWDQLDGDVRAKLEAADPPLSPESLSRVMDELGHPVGATAIRRHLAGPCRTCNG